MEPNKKHHYGVMLDSHDEARVKEERQRDDRASIANTIVALMREGLRQRRKVRRLESKENNNGAH